MKFPSSDKLAKSAGTVALVATGVIVAGLFLAWAAEGGAGAKVQELTAKAQAGLTGVV